MAKGAPGERGSAGPEVSNLSYSDAGSELDAIIKEFETGVVDVDRLVEQLERATDIVDELDRRLRRTRMRVEELVPRLEAVGRGEVGDDGTDEEGMADDTSDPGADDGGPPGLF
jgi:exodeoxyribonuclease VII small subunit